MEGGTQVDRTRSFPEPRVKFANSQLILYSFARKIVRGRKTLGPLIQFSKFAITFSI